MADNLNKKDYQENVESLIDFSELTNKEENVSLISELSAGISENLTGYDNIILKSIYLDLDINEKKNNYIK